MSFFESVSDLSRRSSSRKQSANYIIVSQPTVLVPPGVKVGTYRITSPLIKPSKLTTKEEGGIGKQLSNGWALNFAVGCTHACVFCYVDSIHKRYGESRYGDLVKEKWGNYFLVPSNIDEAIEATPWEKWKGQEVMMSSTHDAYLPQLCRTARRLLEAALPHGVRFCVQTRSPLVTKDFDLFLEYKEQVRIQVSVSTMRREFARLIEPRVASPMARLDVIRRAKDLGLEAGVIVAPVFPSVPQRPDVRVDLGEVISELEPIHPDHVYGECIHVRGENVRLIREALGADLGSLGIFDEEARSIFESLLRKHHLIGTWWPEHKRS
jgi:DNA repair photolyase